MTIKELKELIRDLPDDAPVFAMDSEAGEREASAEIAFFRWDAKHGWWDMLGRKPRKRTDYVKGVLVG